METSSSHIELNLPTTPSETSNHIPSSGLTGAIAPIPIGSDIKPFPSFDFMFGNKPTSQSDA